METIDLILYWRWWLFKHRDYKIPALEWYHISMRGACHIAEHGGIPSDTGMWEIFERAKQAGQVHIAD